MATFNERNQQILGILAMAQGASNLLKTNTPTSERLRSRQPDDPKMARGAAKIIEQSRAGIRKWGIEKPSLTYVGFTPPKIFDDVVPDSRTIVRDLVSLRAERVATPGVQINTSTVRRYGVGPMEKMPHTASFGDMGISFIGDARGVIHQFFYAWMRGIVGFHDVPRNGPANDSLYGFQPYEVGYRKNYSTIIDIITYDEIQEKIGTIKLYNAYPIAVGEIARSWDSVNDLVRIPVTFAYTHWNYADQLNIQLIEPNRTTLAESNSSLFSNVMKGMTAMQAISAIKRPQNVNDIINTVNTGSTLLKSFLPSNRINY